MANNVVSTVLDIEGSLEEVTDHLYENGLTDGLPVIPPTPAKVTAMVSGTDRDAEERIGAIPPKYGEATVEKIAVNAVMAGCKPEYMPVLMAAVQAMTEDKFDLYGVNATTHPTTPLLIINGPIINELNINYGYNVFGEGWRANASIGRAIRLIMRNIGDVRPGDTDKATHGHPGKFSFCIAENERKSPWEPLHVRRGFDKDESTVTAFAAEAPHEIDDHVNERGNRILAITADTLASLGNNNAYLDGEVGIVFGPAHADLIADDGWTPEDIQKYIYDQARNKLSQLKHGGLYGSHDWPIRFELEDNDAEIPIVRSPEDVLVMVSGGAGKHSMALPTGAISRSVTKRISE